MPKSLNLKSISENIQKATRDGFGDALNKLASFNTDIVALTADLKSSLRLDKFSENYPGRFIQVGVAEQNMMGIAAGLAKEGLIPFVTSFAVFNPGRNWDQLRVSACYQNLNIKIIGSHSGFSNVGDGATHQALEDIAITRCLPNIQVFSAADYNDALYLTDKISRIEGPCYLRLTRNKTPVFIEDPSNNILKSGKDITLATTGPNTKNVLDLAYSMGVKYNIDIEVVNCNSIEPLPEALLTSILKTKKVISIEEHQITGGLGSKILEELSNKSILVPTKLIGVNRRFGESGDYNSLIKKHKLDKLSIEKEILSFLHK